MLVENRRAAELDRLLTTVLDPDQNDLWYNATGSEALRGARITAAYATPITEICRPYPGSSSWQERR